MSIKVTYFGCFDASTDANAISIAEYKRYAIDVIVDRFGRLWRSCHRNLESVNSCSECRVEKIAKLARSRQFISFFVGK
jgi:hypothetical protein